MRHVFERTLQLLTFTTVSAGCDPLVSREYQGESRLALKVAVETGRSTTKDSIVPALGYLDGETLRFDSVEPRGEFPAEFRIDVYSAPKGKLLTPLEPLLAPEARIAIQFLAALPKKRRDLTIDLGTKELPEHALCWNGSCDVQPGRETRCSKGDEDPRCSEEAAAQCTGDGCRAEREIELDDTGLSDELKNIVGFSQGHVVLYVRDALPAQSWAAMRLGAPDGLSIGYHLAALREPDEAAVAEASKCEGRAREQALDAYNAERDSPLDVQTMRCFFGEEAACDLYAIPTGDDAKELAARVARAEVEARCSLLAVDMAPVDPADETITVRIGDDLPEWQATRPSTPTDTLTP